MKQLSALILVAVVGAGPALAGPPYVTDDPEPTEHHHYEIYFFGAGSTTRDGSDATTGVDFNYGAAPNLQLTAVIPLAISNPKGGPTTSSLGNIELAAKYKFLHQETAGWDVALFPRIFLPAASAEVGERHASLLLPVWVGRSWDGWSTFGGAGCTLNRGGGSQDFCQAGWALTRQVLPNLQVGGEIYHAGADQRGGKATTGIGLGVTYDINETYHLLASYGPGVQNAAETNRGSWYVSLQTTF